MGKLMSVVCAPAEFVVNVVGMYLILDRSPGAFLFALRYNLGLAEEGVDFFDAPTAAWVNEDWSVDDSFDEF